MTSDVEGQSQRQCDQLPLCQWCERLVFLQRRGCGHVALLATHQANCRYV